MLCSTAGAIPRHPSSVVQSSFVKVVVITPPLDPLPVQGGDGCWVLSPAPFPGPHRQSSNRPSSKNHKPKHQQPQTKNHKPQTNTRPPSIPIIPVADGCTSAISDRSEERRVGKGGRYRWEP